MEYIIRRRKKEDCLSIAHVVTVGWNETYKGIVPDWFLEELKTNEKERADRMVNNFDENNSGTYIYQYSKNRDRRLKIEETIDAVKVGFEKFCLNPDATIDFPENLNENPYALLGWYEDDGTRSIYKDFQTAIQDCKNYLE